MEHTQDRLSIIRQYGKAIKYKISTTKEEERHNKSISIKGARDAKDNGGHCGTILSEVNRTQKPGQHRAEYTEFFIQNIQNIQNIHI